VASQPADLKPAAITGVGAVTPLGVGADTLYERWRDGDSGLDEGVGACRDFDPSILLNRKQARRTERFVQMALVACDEATRQAGWGEELPYPAERVSSILGVSLGGTQVLFDQYQVLLKSGAAAVWPLTIPVTMPNAGPAVLAMKHGFHGETRSIASACASSTQAIGEALGILRLGAADAVIVGGAEACLTDFVLAAFRMGGALSPSGESRPFDKRHDGFVMAEGAGILILEDADRAAERGAEVLGYITGYGSTTDGAQLSAPAKDGKACAAAISASLADAGRTPEEVDWVSAHATSVPAHDRAETMALKEALGDHAERVPVSAPKSSLGHPIGASGAIEAIATLGALRAGMAPPTLGFEEAEEGMALDHVHGEPRALGGANGKGRSVAISSSFAFGGQNATLTIEA
jgi:3-oxoacyl-[acyl-carrier-protein] synthase II